MGGVSRFSVETFLSHSAENFRRGILYCCKNFRYQKKLVKRGKHQKFPSKFFCLLVQKIFVGEPFFVSLISGIEKFYAYEENITIFLRIFFASHCRKFSQGNPLLLQNFRVSKTSRGWSGGSEYQDFPSNFFVSQCRKLPSGNPSLLK